MSTERETTPVSVAVKMSSPVDANTESSATTVTKELASLKINGVNTSDDVADAGDDVADAGAAAVAEEGNQHAGTESAPASKEASVVKDPAEGGEVEGEDGDLVQVPRRGGNEDRKIFVGGIAFDVTNEDLSSHFIQFGEIVSVQVKYDRATGRSRGFAFVEFATVEACRAALDKNEQFVKKKLCEIKPAKSRETNKKVFVGGLPSDFPEEELRTHFEQYGTVEEIEWPYDKQSMVHRNYAFIVFEDEAGADRAASEPKQMFGSREADVKKAVPQSKRNSFVRGLGGMGGGGIGSFGMFAPNRTPTTYLGAYRGYGVGGAPASALQSAAQWFHNALGMPSNGWAATAAAAQAMQAMSPYGAAGAPHHGNGTGATVGGHAASGWGDSSIWYGNAVANAAAAAANHYYTQGVGGPNNTVASSTGGYGGTGGGYGSNGYDYGSVPTSGSMSGLLGRHPSAPSAHHHHHQPTAHSAHYAHGQNGNGTGGGQRYSQQPAPPSQPPQF